MVVLLRQYSLLCRSRCCCCLVLLSFVNRAEFACVLRVAHSHAPAIFTEISIQEILRLFLRPVWLRFLPPRPPSPNIPHDNVLNAHFSGYHLCCSCPQPVGLDLARILRALPSPMVDFNRLQNARVQSDSLHSKDANSKAENSRGRRPCAISKHFRNGTTPCRALGASACPLFADARFACPTFCLRMCDPCGYAG